MKVLLVDDDHGSREILAGFLRKKEFEVLEAGTGEEALDMVKQKQPRALLLDWRLPGISGLEVLDALSQGGHRPERVCMLTGMDGIEEIKAMKQAGADHIFHKPYDLLEILTLLNDLKG